MYHSIAAQMATTTTNPPATIPIIHHAYRAMIPACREGPLPRLTSLADSFTDCRLLTGLCGHRAAMRYCTRLGLLHLPFMGDGFHLALHVFGGGFGLRFDIRVAGCGAFGWFGFDCRPSWRHRATRSTVSFKLSTAASRYSERWKPSVCTSEKLWCNCRRSSQVCRPAQPTTSVSTTMAKA